MDGNEHAYLRPSIETISTVRLNASVPLEGSPSKYTGAFNGLKPEKRTVRAKVPVISSAINAAAVIAILLRVEDRGCDSVLSKEDVSSTSSSALCKSAFLSSGSRSLDVTGRVVECFGMGKLEEAMRWVYIWPAGAKLSRNYLRPRNVWRREDGMSEAKNDSCHCQW